MFFETPPLARIPERSQKALVFEIQRAHWFDAKISESYEKQGFLAKNARFSCYFFEPNQKFFLVEFDEFQAPRRHFSKTKNFS